eukprot:scaffold120360_cov39-Tisochrysis_lutea.AAC.1
MPPACAIATLASPSRARTRSLSAACAHSADVPPPRSVWIADSADAASRRLGAALDGLGVLRRLGAPPILTRERAPCSLCPCVSVTPQEPPTTPR